MNDPVNSDFDHWDAMNQAYADQAELDDVMTVKEDAANGYYCLMLLEYNLEDEITADEMRECYNAINANNAYYSEILINADPWDYAREQMRLNNPEIAVRSDFGTEHQKQKFDYIARIKAAH